MDVREKLVEILKQAPFEVKVLDEWWWEEKIKRIADHLISNGVTVPEWVSANDRLPNEPMRCLVYTKRGEYWDYEITYYNQEFYTQYAETIYWMPLPPAPEDMK